MDKNIMKSVNPKRANNKKTILDGFRKELIMEFNKRLKNLQYDEIIQIQYRIIIIDKYGNVRKGKNAQRNMKVYNEWRKAIYQRDKYTCRECGKTNTKLNAHHIKSWRKYPELRFELNNGITLCEECHYRKHPHIKILKKYPPAINL